MMSIIAGKWRGTKLTSVDSPSVRPTAQRTRSALFNILNGGRYEVNIENALVIDLFAGSGALGLEALSRGADQAFFIENDNKAIQVITRNIERLACQHQSVVLKQDACQPLSWSQRPADMVFCDPPYHSGFSAPALNLLYQAGAIDDHTLISVETKRGEPVLENPAFVLLETRNYGIAQICFYRLA